MTLEQENDFKFLSNLLLNENKHLSIQELKILIEPLMGAISVSETFQRLINSGYLKKEYAPINSSMIITSEMDRSIYSVSIEGSNYWKFLNKENKIEKLQYEQIQSVMTTNKSVETTNVTQRRFIKLTAFISLLTLIATVYNTWRQKPIIINVAPSPVLKPQTSLPQDTPLLTKGLKQNQIIYRKKDTSKKK